MTELIRGPETILVKLKLSSRCCVEDMCSVSTRHREYPRHWRLESPSQIVSIPLSVGLIYVNRECQIRWMSAMNADSRFPMQLRNHSAVSQRSTRVRTKGSAKKSLFSHRLHERDTDGQMALPRTSDRNFRMARWESSPFYLGVPRNAVRQRTFGFVLGTVNLQVN